ncbi:MAG: oxygen-independent coproporphyrinogen III oxidase-like protein [Rhodocyclaceae bacterium]|nr:oxygen-independent coproporphyrinogen III oxidase-like protein [Rhodocyclaceae bacterium]
MHTIPIRPVQAAPSGSLEIALDAPPPLALYVHFPWCVRKCPYCDFNSHAVRDEIPQAAYVDALLADLETALPQIWGRRLQTVFIGGGTPSLIEPPQLDRLLEGVRALGNLVPGAEITLEANPGTVDTSRMRDFRAAGVTRLSLGVQSFDDRLLARIGRIHGGRDARLAVDAALSHFDRVNIDLMYALPGQSMTELDQDLDVLTESGVEHLSCYHLTIEPNTAFHASPPPIPDEDLASDMQDRVEERLAAAGYGHYETSAFARPGGRCQHNLNYWRFGDYLGIGAGAHGKLSGHTGIVREMRHRHPGAYLDGAQRRDFVQDTRQVAAADLPFEFMMNALRLIDGFEPGLFAATTGLPWTRVEPLLVEARREGFLAFDGACVRPTERGRHFLNDLLQRFLPD